MMTHTRGNSAKGFRALSEGVDSLFDTVFGLRRPFLEPKGIWRPPMDVFENEREYVVIMDIAGIRQEDVRVSYESGALTIQGVRHEIDYGTKRHFHIMEIDFGPFERRIQLPKIVDREKIEAMYKDGILEVRLEKKPEPMEKTVTIEVE
jgi:HSP20 family protein